MIKWKDIYIEVKVYSELVLRKRLEQQTLFAFTKLTYVKKNATTKIIENIIKNNDLKFFHKQQSQMMQKNNNYLQQQQLMSEFSNYRKPASPYYSSRDYFKDNLRVLKRNLLFCSGVPLTLTEEELKSQQYFGKYGTVLKVTLLKNIRQMSVYVTYADTFQASLAIIATNDFQLDKYHKLASIYGTIKYCKYFLKKIQCKNLPNCNYLHVYDKKNEIYINNQLPDQVFDEHYNIALLFLKQVDIPKIIKQKRLIANSDKNGDVLPCAVEALMEIGQERSGWKEEKNCECESGINRSEYGDQQEEEQYQSLNESIKSPRSCSQKQTYETVRSQNKQQTTLNQQQFPKITCIIHSQRKQAPRQQNKQQPHHQIRLYALHNQSKQSMQIRLIRRMLREQRSKLTQWTEGNKTTAEQVNLFYKGLDESNQLKDICDWETMRETIQQEERVKFLIIKNIHHNHARGILTHKRDKTSSQNSPKNKQHKDKNYKAKHKNDHFNHNSDNCQS